MLLLCYNNKYIFTQKTILKWLVPEMEGNKNYNDRDNLDENELQTLSKSKSFALFQ